jgi:hypothetical protein
MLCFEFEIELISGSKKIKKIKLKLIKKGKLNY